MAKAQDYRAERIAMKISVIGAGYVGLTTAACLAHIGHDVLCSESDLNKLKMLQEGVIPIFEPHLEDMIAAVQAGGTLGWGCINPQYGV